MSRHHRFFRFQFSEPADIVLTTSDRAQGGFGGVTYTRSVTAVGNLSGATAIARSIGYTSPRRPTRVYVSAELETSLSGDVVVIGLPGKNEVSGAVVTHLTARYPNLGLTIDESTEGCSMSLAGFADEYSVVPQTAQPDFPERDLALIVLWVNPIAVRKRRLVLCAGFTAYGTAAAARYLVDDILPHRLNRLRAEHTTMPSLWSHKWTCFAMLIETRLVNDQVIEVRELAFAPLDDPGCPPFESGEHVQPSARNQRDDILGLTEDRREPIAPGD